MKKQLLFCLLLTQTCLFGQWNLITDQIGPSFFCNSVGYEGKIYINGGPKTSNLGGALDTKLYILDLATEAVEIAPGGLSTSRYGGAIIAHNGKIYCAGGVKVTGGAFISTDIIDVYDIALKTWAVKKMSVPKNGFTAAVVGDKILFAGGYGNTAMTDVVDIYDTSNDSWDIAHLSNARGETSATVINGKAWFCGGTTTFDLPYAASSRIDIYDPSQPVGSQWSTAELSKARVAPAAVAIGDTLLVAGGFSSSSPKMNNVDIINTKTASFSTAQLSAPRAYPAAATVGKKAYFTGGGNYNQGTYFFDVSSNVVDVFDGETKKWSTQTLTLNRMAHACSAWGNKIAVAGGWRANWNSTIGNVEILTDNSVAVENVAPEMFGFSISPNPVSDFLNLSFLDKNAAAAASEISITDAAGRVVWLEKIAENAFSDSKRIETAALSAGLYFLSVVSKDGKRRATTAFSVQK